MAVQSIVLKEAITDMLLSRNASPQVEICKYGKLCCMHGGVGALRRRMRACTPPELIPERRASSGLAESTTEPMIMTYAGYPSCNFLELL